ncbi:MAG: 50S ribosomal protein L3 N(5)-glutamine methyltransferase [Oleiphilaceae bacterium]|nr:50S ribosomal protein L3 N(5)-glutamine methyltransferase [Oleiphilaceae bacterium]
MPDNLASIADHIRYSFSQLQQAEVFFGHGYESAWDEAVHLVLQSLHLPWDFAQELWHCRLTREECDKIGDAINQRISERKPLAYITGQAWFCGLAFEVNPSVLIPRSPIAELIENDFQPWLNNAPSRILDICTGSGCIGIAMAMQFEAADVDLIDISPEALAIARRNIARYGLEDRVEAVLSDGCAEILEARTGAYDLIVSNPPYVDADDLAAMPPEYHHEPRLGLEAGKDGLDLVHRLLREAAQLISADGLLVMEVGNSWEALEAAYPETAFTWIEFERGGHGVFVMSAQELKAMPLVSPDS